MIKECSKAILDSIRESSKSGLLLPEKEIFSKFTQKLVKSHEQIRDDAIKAMLDEVISSNEDITVLYDSIYCRYYYSALTMTEAYARLLLLKKENSLHLMASIIRENSAKYPRPIPITVFQNFPFELRQDDILLCINKMIELQEYEDIEQVTTSIGNLFFYSKRYLDFDYAMMLAEWEDVGCIENP
ncbi:MAG: hypothetical protein HQK79_16500 [Desulfobacterales bacterium]|nr:hypothetical protein [Desulfobacterales bacterium]MBF0398651.1 hypothetical protein [Desulfobacterales bacterium]